MKKSRKKKSQSSGTEFRNYYAMFDMQIEWSGMCAASFFLVQPFNQNAPLFLPYVLFYFLSKM